MYDFVLILMILTAISTNLTENQQNTKKILRIPLTDVEKGQILAWIENDPSNGLGIRFIEIYMFFAKFKTHSTTDTLPRSGRPKLTTLSSTPCPVEWKLLSKPKDIQPSTKSRKYYFQEAKPIYIIKFRYM